jgi:hypothetical protein
VSPAHDPTRFLMLLRRICRWRLLLRGSALDSRILEAWAQVFRCAEEHRACVKSWPCRPRSIVSPGPRRQGPRAPLGKPSRCRSPPSSLMILWSWIRGSPQGPQERPGLEVVGRDPIAAHALRRGLRLQFENTTHDRDAPGLGEGSYPNRTSPRHCRSIALDHCLRRRRVLLPCVRRHARS